MAKENRTIRTVFLVYDAFMDTVIKDHTIH